MNIEVRQPSAAPRRASASSTATFIRENSLDDLRPYLSNRWWDHLQTYGQRQRHGYVKGYPYPKSQPLACRRDAWPPGGGLPASDLDFMREQHPRPLRHRLRRDESAVAVGAGRPERRAQRRHGVRHQRIAARTLEPARAAAQGLDRHPLRGRRRLGRGDQAARGRPAFRPCAVPEPHQRAAGQEALLADLRGRGGGRPPDRRARVRLERTTDVQHRLAVVLHRGNHRALRFAGSLGHELDHRGRVRALAGT